MHRYPDSSLCFLFPGGSDGKASACNEGDPGSIPGWGPRDGTHISCTAGRSFTVEPPGKPLQLI